MMPSRAGKLVKAARATTCVLLFLTPFMPRWVLIHRPVDRIMLEFSSTLFYWVDVPLILAVGLWLAAHYMDTSRPIKLGPSFITTPLVILAVLSGLSVLWASSRSLPAEMFVRLCLLLALYLLIRNDLTNWRTIAWVLAAGMAVQSVVAMLQFAVQGPLGLAFLGETGAAVTVPGIWIRGYGFSAHPNILGGYIAIGLFSSVALALSAAQRRERFAALLVFGAGVGGLLSTFSRSAWVGCALGLGLAGVAILSNSHRPAQWGRTLLLLSLVGASVCLPFVASNPDYFISRIMVPLNLVTVDSGTEHPELDNLRSRQRYRNVAWQLIRNDLPLGVGSGNFSVASYLLEPDLPADHVYLPVHDVALLLTAELGLAGGFTWAFLLMAFVTALWRSRAHLARSPWFLACSMAALCLFVTGFFDFYIWGWQYGRLMLWSTLGLWAAAYDHGANR